MRQQNGSKPTVLYVTSDFKVGGTELLLVKLVKGLDREKFYPIVACFRKHGPLLAEIAKLDVEVVEFDIPKTTTMPYQFLRLVCFMRRRNVQVVHAMLGSTKVYAGLAGWAAGTPARICTRLNMGYWTGPIGRHIVDFMLRRMYHSIIVNSRMIKDDLVNRARVAEDRIEIVYNGIDIALFSKPVDIRAKKAELGIPEGRLVFGTVATLRPIKGLHVLVEAAKAVLRQYPDAHFVFVGDGPCREDLIAQAKSLGIADHVTFCGSRTDVSEILVTFDVFVLSSLSEGFPNTVCEALVRGLPVVSTDVGGVREAVLQERTGLVVPANDPQALADSMIRLAGDDALRHAMSMEGARLAREKFSLGSMIRSIERIYQDHLLKSNAG